jgi:hypothetical protein
VEERKPNSGIRGGSKLISFFSSQFVLRWHLLFLIALTSNVNKMVLLAISGNP